MSGLGLRLRVMSLLGLTADRLASETRAAAVREQDRERLARFGDQGPSVARAQAFAAELEAKAETIAAR